MARSPQDLMRLALDLARRSVAAGGGPFGAVVARDGEVIASGSNAVTGLLDPTAHAEIEAIRAACRSLATFSLQGCELYASCEPCPMCLGAIHWARLERVYYAGTRDEAAATGFDDAAIWREMCKRPQERGIGMVRLLAEEAIQPFKDWEAKEDRAAY